MIIVRKLEITTEATIRSSDQMAPKTLSNEALARKAESFVASTEGQAILQKSTKKADEVIVQLNSLDKVDPKQFEEPITL